MRRKLKGRGIIILFILSIAAVSYYIFSYSKGWMHSDTASKVLFANQQHMQHKLFPDGFCYSTGVFICGIENLIYLVMFFIKDWVLCREVAQFIQTIILVLSFLCFFFTLFEKKEEKYAGGFICTILFILPLSVESSIYDLYFYQAAYAKQVILLMLTYVFIWKIVAEEDRKKQGLYFICLICVTVLNNLGIRTIITAELPIIMSLVVCAVDFQEKKIELARNEKKVIGVSCFAMVLGLVIYKVIEHYVGWQNQIGLASFITPQNIVSHIAEVFKALFQIYGVGYKTEILSLTGITLPFKFSYMVISAFVVPVFWMLKFNKIENKRWKMFVCYSWISNLFMTYLYIFTTVGGPSAQYHYLTVYVNHTVMLVGTFIFMWKKADIIIKKGILFGAIVCIALFHASYISECSTIIAERENEDEQLLQYLEENGLEFGYATYWNAYKYTALTSGRIQVIGYEGEPNTPRYWLTSRQWYEPDYHQGRSFVLLAEGEQIDEKYYLAAEQIGRVGEYTVLMYSQNLRCYTDLMYDDLHAGAERDVMPSLQVVGNGYQYQDTIYLKEGGIQFGPYIELESGMYEVCIKGNHLAQAAFKMQVGELHEEHEVQMKEITDEQAVYQFVLETPSSYVEFLTLNEKSKELVEIEQVTVKCLERDSMVYYPLQLMHTDRAYYTAGNLILENGGEEYGPYVDLEAGIYVVRVNGDNLDLAEFSVTANAAAKDIPVELIEREKNRVIFTFRLEDAQQDIEYHIRNTQKELVMVSKLSVQGD